MNITIDSPNASKYIITRVTPDGKVETVGCVISYNDETKVMVRQRLDEKFNLLETYEETTDNCMIHEPKPNKYGLAFGFVEHEDARCIHYLEAAIAAYKKNEFKP